MNLVMNQFEAADSKYKAHVLAAEKIVYMEFYGG